MKLVTRKHFIRVGAAAAASLMIRPFALAEPASSKFYFAIIADTQVCRNVALHLRLAAAERHQHAEREKFARRNVQAATGKMVAETIGGKQTLNMLRVRRRRGV